MNSQETAAKYGKVFFSASAEMVSIDTNLVTKRLTKSLHAPVSGHMEDGNVVFRVMGDPKKASETLRRLAPSLFPGYVEGQVRNHVRIFAHYQDGLVMELMGCNWLAAKLARECRPGLKFFRGQGGKVLSKKVLAALGA
jgi:hypothetical protein